MIKSNSIQTLLISLIVSILLSSYSSAQGLSYLGQNPPGLSPVLFAPENLRANSIWKWHSSPVFSPDGNEMFFVKYYHSNGKLEINYMQILGNVWTEPTLPNFADSNYNENCPIFSPGGDTLYFRSERPGGKIFMTIKSKNVWGDPAVVPIPFPEDSFIGWQFCVIKNKSIYFEIWDGDGYDNVDIYFTRYINGVYQTPEILPNNINTEYYEWGPYVNQENDYILFSSNRESGLGFNDIYISSRDINETWSDPIPLGSEINSNFEDVYPIITFDGNYFFFGNQKSGDLGLNPYWVDAQVVYNLITDIDDENNTESPATFQLYPNYPNPFNPTTKITYSIPRLSNVLIKVYDILGNEIETLVDEEKPAGEYVIEFEGRGMSSGVYFYELRVGDFVETKKMILIR